MSVMSDTDETSDPQPAPAAPVPAQPAATAAEPGGPTYAAPVAPTKERFLDRLLDMRAVIAVALAALIIGGLSGFILGEHTGGDDHGFGRGGPDGFPGGQGFPGGPQGTPGQQGQPPFGSGQPMR
jgi:hypothetical protein